MKNLFISYSKEDSEIVSELEKRLEEFYQVFVDRSELTGGIDWEKRIKLGIEECDVFLAVASPPADESEWVARETIYAESLKKPRIPLLLEGVLPFRLLNLQYVDFRGGIEAGFADLLKALRPLAAPELRGEHDADHLVGRAVRSRIGGDIARSNDLLAQAQAIDLSFVVGDFWVSLGGEPESVFLLDHIQIRETTSKVTPSKYKNHDTFRWNLSLEGAEGMLDQISHVEYRLHPSFPKTQQTVRDRASGFELSELGWGIFVVNVDIHLHQLDTPETFSYHLTFKQDNLVGATDEGIDQPPVQAGR